MQEKLAVQKTELLSDSSASLPGFLPSLANLLYALLVQQGHSVLARDAFVGTSLVGVLLVNRLGSHKGYPYRIDSGPRTE